MAQAKADVAANASKITSGYEVAGVGSYHAGTAWVDWDNASAGTDWTTGAFGTITFETKDLEFIAHDDTGSDPNDKLNRIYIPLTGADDGVTASIVSGSTVLTGGTGTAPTLQITTVVQKLDSDFFDAVTGAPVYDADTGDFVVEITPGSGATWGWAGDETTDTNETLVFNLMITQPGAKPTVYVITVPITTPTS